MLKQEQLDKDKAAERVAKIQRNAERVAKIVSSLLSIFKGDKQDLMSELNLPQLVEMAAENHAYRFKAEQITFTYDGHGVTPAPPVTRNRSFWSLVAFYRTLSMRLRN